MRVLYYQYDGTTYIVCVRSDASGRSPIWQRPNSSSWIVPCEASYSDD